MNAKRSKMSYRTWCRRIQSVMHNRYTTLVVMAFSISGAAIVWHWTNFHFQDRNQDRFEFEATKVHDRIAKRMADYEQALRGGVALYRSCDEVSRENWRNYVDGSEVLKRYPGIQAMAVSVVVPVSELERHTEKIRNEGFTDYAIHPMAGGARNLYSAIVFIEPFDWRNQRAFGYDMYSESVRRLAMNRAIDTGQASITSKITLVQETNVDSQSGILCYLPIYNQGAKPDSIEDRRKELQGWIYAAFRLDNLMKGIVGNDPNDVTFKIFDTHSLAAKDLLYDSSQNPASNVSQKSAIVKRMQPGGHNWTIQFSGSPNLLTAAQQAFSGVVGIGGLLFNCVLYVVLGSLRKQSESAKEIASRMSIGFECSESRNQLILENASEAILSVSVNGLILAANSAAHAVFNAENLLIGRQIDRLIPDLQLTNLPKTPQSLPTENGISIQCLDEDGTEFPGRVSIGALESDYEPMFVVIVRDETARIEAEKKLEDINRKLIAASHKAGVAEVASGALHNVGNAVNSVNVSTSLLRKQIDTAPVEQLFKASAVIEENVTDLAGFFQEDKRAQHFPSFLKQLAASFQQTQNNQLIEIDQLMKSIQHIKEVISLQQSTARKHLRAENEKPSDLFEDAVKMNDSKLAQCKIEIIRDFEDIPILNIRKHEVLQILVNLIKNAQQAIEMLEHERRSIILKLRTDGDLIVFSVTDTGIGISTENAGMMFQHGFTTKKTGHGFGLHSSNITAQEMGGSLTVESEGEGHGATFILRVPFQLAQDNPVTDDGEQKCASSPIAPRNSEVKTQSAMLQPTP